MLTVDSSQTSGVKWATPSTSSGAPAITVQSGNYTATSGWEIIVFTGTSGATITLTKAAGAVYIVKRIDAAVGSLVVQDSDSNQLGTDLDTAEESRAWAYVGSPVNAFKQITSFLGS